jgi:hypothetical protein
LIHRAGINGWDAFPVVTDGQDQETIGAVARGRRFEGFAQRHGSESRLTVIFVGGFRGGSMDPSLRLCAWS